jgi:Asp/Glu/hydantoin racemase
MRILLINPNTSPEITDLVARRAREVADEDVMFVPATGRFGARYIASRAAAAIAGHAALDALAEHGEGCDAVILACFGDPGLPALRELSPVPVVGMAEASCHLACTLGRRFSIVTGGARWGPMLEEFVASLGLADRFAGVRTVAPTGAEIAQDPDGTLALLVAQCSSCADEDGADVVILGGAGLAGLARTLAPLVDVPVLCSVEVAVQAAIVVARMSPKKPKDGTFGRTQPVETSGLSPELAYAMNLSEC